MKRPLVIILGATAVGKTKTSLAVAKMIGGEIISTDSRQIYKEMPIATDVITEKEQEGVPHHMLEFRNPDEPLTLAEYKEQALEIIDEIYARNHIPMLVGGTGLYISAITEGYDVPRIPPNPEFRAKLEKEAEKNGPEFIHQKLSPEKQKTIHPNNIRYVIRALEIQEAGGKPDQKTQESPFDTFFIGLERPREEIYKRIEERVDQQESRGLLEEVQALIDKGYDENLPSMTSLGVKEIIPYLRGEMELKEALIILKRNTRRYAKRQMTWLKRYDNVTWLTPEKCQKELSTILKNFAKN